jgi:D-3-phosphoglycerate dehydrogenase
MADILVTEKIVGAGMDRLREEFTVVEEPELWRDPSRLQALIPGYRALIVRNQTPVTAELIRAGTRLEVIGRAGVGLDNVDLEAASAAGITVAFTPEQNSNSVAELVIGLILALARKIPLADRLTRAGGWDRPRLTGIEISGRTLGLIGFGRIGALTAAKARALGMEILACDPQVDPESLRVLELRAEMVTLEELLARSDFVSCHLPETAATRGLLDADRLALLRPSAFFINTARGGVVDEAALVAALEAGRIAGAALDVRRVEPPEPDRLNAALTALDNVILLPHIGAFTAEGQRRVVTAVCGDVAAVLRGGAARYHANFSRPLKLEGGSR